MHDGVGGSLFVCIKVDIPRPRPTGSGGAEAVVSRGSYEEMAMARPLNNKLKHTQHMRSQSRKGQVKKRNGIDRVGRQDYLRARKEKVSEAQPVSVLHWVTAKPAPARLAGFCPPRDGGTLRASRLRVRSWALGSTRPLPQFSNPWALGRLVHSPNSLQSFMRDALLANCM